MEQFCKDRKINLAIFLERNCTGTTSIKDPVFGLDKERFNIIFVYLTGDGVQKDLAEGCGYKIYYLTDRRRIRSFGFSIILKFAKILRQNQIDILHCHAHKQTVYGTLAAIFARVPIVVSQVHGLNRTRNLGRRIVNYFIFKKINRIVAVSKVTGEDVLRTNWRLPADKVYVLENSVDYNRFANSHINREEVRTELGLSPKSFVFGTVGRLVPTKGLEYMIEAFAKVRQNLENVELLLIGDGVQKDELKKFAKEMKCAEFVNFAGRKNNVERIYKSMDCFVLSSIAEGMPRVILEAMAARVPLVATAVGGIPEIISDNKTGFLVHHKDSKILADVMLKIAMMSKEEVEKLVEKAQTTVRQFYSHSVASEKLRDVYEIAFTECIKPRS